MDNFNGNDDSVSAHEKRVDVEAHVFLRLRLHLLAPPPVLLVAVGGYKIQAHQIKDSSPFLSFPLSLSLSPPSVCSFPRS